MSHGCVAVTWITHFDKSPSLDDALRSLVKGPQQQGAPAGTLIGKLGIGWGRHDLVTLPSQSVRALARFPDATLHWFDDCGPFSHCDKHAHTVELIRSSTA